MAGFHNAARKMEKMPATISGNEIEFLHRYFYHGSPKPPLNKNFGKAIAGDNASIAFTPARDIVVELHGDSISIVFASAKNFTNRPTEFSFRNTTTDYPGIFELSNSAISLQPNSIFTSGNIFWVNLEDVLTTAPMRLDFTLTDKPPSSVARKTIPLETFELKTGNGGGSNIYDARIVTTVTGSASVHATQLISFDYSLIRYLDPSSTTKPYLLTSDGEISLDANQSGTHTFALPYTGELTVGVHLDPSQLGVMAQFWNFFVTEPA